MFPSKMNLSQLNDWFNQEMSSPVSWTMGTPEGDLWTALGYHDKILVAIAKWEEDREGPLRMVMAITARGKKLGFEVL
jgi:hypothetical protein